MICLERFYELKVAGEQNHNLSDTKNLNTEWNGVKGRTKEFPPTTLTTGIEPAEAPYRPFLLTPIPYLGSRKLERISESMKY